MTDQIVTEVDGSVLKVRINRPDKKNALTVAMYAALADAIVCPAGEKVTSNTLLEWPSSVRSARPVRASHSLTEVSSLAEATLLPSGENATACTPSECP